MRDPIWGNDVDWAAFPWPEPGDYDRRQILSALRAVIRPDPADWSDPGTLVRFAVGNDHRGTVYPAAVAMTDVLLKIAAACPGEPRRVALDVLEAWWSGFEPEHGFASYVDAAGHRVAVLPEIARRVTAATDLLTGIEARALLTVIPLGWGHTLNEDGGVEFWGGRLNPDGSVHFPRGG